MARYALLAACLAAAAPAGAAAASHSVAVRVHQGSKSFSKTVKTPAGAEANFRGPVAGKNLIVNVLLTPKGKAFTLEYQLEVSEPGGRSFQAQSSLELRPGERVAAVDCGGWKIDLALDSTSMGPAPAWKPDGPNYRLTARTAARLCRVVQGGASQSNVVDSGFILNSMLASKAGDAFGLDYQLEESSKQEKGTATLLLGKKARGGSIEFLLEGRPVAAAAEAPRRTEEPQKGAVRMLR